MSDSSFKEAARQSKRISNDPYLTQQHQIIIGGPEPFTGDNDSDIELNTPGNRHSLRQFPPNTNRLSANRLSAKRLSASNIGSVPNGGTIAWLQVLASFFLFFNSWGIINTYGMFHHTSRSFLCCQISSMG
jgi:hypothetical protein